MLLWRTPFLSPGEGKGKLREGTGAAVSQSGGCKTSPEPSLQNQRCVKAGDKLAFFEPKPLHSSGEQEGLGW